MPLFSIITVCRDAEQRIERTLKSVLNQSYTDYEYIIIDGLSNDNTMSFIQRYRENFQQNGVQYSFCSEQDTGIYNAMNKGIMRSSGRWLLFLNAGDTLCCNRVLEKFSMLVDDRYDIVYGDVIYEFYGLYKYEKSLPLPRILDGNPFCHQSAFISRRTMTEYMYDETYKIAGDFDFLIRCYFDHKKFKAIPLPVACFELGGASTNGDITRLFEHIQVQLSNHVFDRCVYEKKYEALEKDRKKMKFRNRLKHLLPEHLSVAIRKLIRKRQGYRKDFPVSETYGRDI